MAVEHLNFRGVDKNFYSVAFVKESLSKTIRPAFSNSVSLIANWKKTIFELSIEGEIQKQAYLIRWGEKKFIWGLETETPFYFRAEHELITIDFPDTNFNFEKTVTKKEETYKLLRDLMPLITIGGGAVKCPLCEKKTDKDCFRQKVPIITANIMPVIKKFDNYNEIYIHLPYVCRKVLKSDKMPAVVYMVEYPFNIFPKPNFPANYCHICKSKKNDIKKAKVSNYFICKECNTYAYNIEINRKIEIHKEPELYSKITQELFYILTLADRAVGLVSMYFNDILKDKTIRINKSKTGIKELAKLVKQKNNFAFILSKFFWVIDSSPEFYSSIIFFLEDILGIDELIKLIKNDPPFQGDKEKAYKAINAIKQRLEILMKVEELDGKTIREELKKIPYYL